MAKKITKTERCLHFSHSIQEKTKNKKLSVDIEYLNLTIKFDIPTLSDHLKMFAGHSGHTRTPIHSVQEGGVYP